MTRTRVVWVLLGIGVCVLVTWVARHTYWGEVTVPMPLRGEALRNPLYATQRLAEALGARTERRNALGDVGRDGVVVLSTFSWDLSSVRRRQLESWVADGGRLVVDATLIAGGEAFERFSGIARVEEPYEADDASDTDALADYGDEDTCPELFEEIGVGLEGQGGRYAVCTIPAGSWLSVQRRPTWQLADDLGPQAVRVRVGRGSVTMVNAAPFLFRDVLSADHGPLFVAAAELQEGDEIVFLSEDDQDSLLTLMWRHGAPAVSLFLLFVALALWRGAVRFGPLAAPADGARRSLTEQIRGTGRFALRWGGGAALHGAALRALDEAAPLHIGGYGRMNEAQRVAALSAFTHTDETALTRAIRFSPDRSFDLASALALLESVRRRISDRDRS